MIETRERTVRCERAEAERVAVLVLEAGRGNVIDSKVIEDLSSALATLASASEVDAVLLDHAGPDFSFGASVAEHAPGEVERMLPRFHALGLAMLRHPVPIVASVRGRCFGGGLELACCATSIFAAANASFAQPELKLGVFAPLGTVLLPRQVGVRRATELLLSGRTFGADEALAYGLVQAIAEDPRASALAWIREHLLTKSGASLRAALRALTQRAATTIEVELLELERAYLDDLMRSHDAREGIQAFLEKRSPRWLNR